MTDNSKDTGRPPQTQEIEILKIITDGQMVRTGQDDDHIAELALSIAKHGLLQPIIVSPLEGGNYQLQAGFHRLEAAKRLQWKKITALIREKDTGSTKNIALVENLLRKDMTLEEESQAIVYLNDVEKLSISSICDATGKSVGWVQKRLMLPNLPEEVKIELFDGKISVGHAEVIASVEDPSVRAILLNCVMQQKLTKRQTEDLASIYKNAPSVGFAINEAVETAQKIQATEKTPQRNCDICRTRDELQNMTLLCACRDCMAWLKEMIQKSINEGKEVGKNG